MNARYNYKKLLQVVFYVSLAAYHLGMGQLFFSFLIGLSAAFMAYAKYRDII